MKTVIIGQRDRCQISTREEKYVWNTRLILSMSRLISVFKSLNLNSSRTCESTPSRLRPAEIDVFLIQL